VTRKEYAVRIRRLGWAGLELESQGQTIVIDLLQDASSMERFVGAPHEPLPAPAAARGTVIGALLSHLHADHADAGALAAALADGAPVLRPAQSHDADPLAEIALAGAEDGLTAWRLRQRHVRPGDSIRIGPFTCTAVRAVDGSGDPQVSWVVAADGLRILHAGDTMMHGFWWRIAMAHGPFDAAFLPVNGAVLDLPHRQPSSGRPAAMTPEDAVGAAAALAAGVLVPIHYGAFHLPPAYDAVQDVPRRLLAAARERGVAVQIVAPGDEVDVEPADIAA
jgi:L-ascorbate metabolism protein UlaG (beta-lactamase superfamily)